MKKIIPVLIICLFVCRLYAQHNSNVRINQSIYFDSNVLCLNKYSDSLLIVVGEFITPVNFDVNKYDIKMTSQLKNAIDSIKYTNDNISYIWVVGSASPEGSTQWNNKLGQYRAEALSNYLSEKTEQEKDVFKIYNQGENWILLENILKGNDDFPNKDHIITILSEEKDNELRKRKIIEIDDGKTWRKLINEIFPPLRNASLAVISSCPKLKPVSSQISSLSPWSVSVNAEKISLAKSKPLNVIDNNVKRSNWKIAAKTNLLFDALLAANLGVEISPWTHWSLDIPVWYSPYNITATRNIRLFAVQPEIRWWSKEAMSGHFVGLHTHVAGFNIALNNYARYQDPNHALWGMGLSYGYAISLGKSQHWGMEFNIGAGFAKYRYDAYRNWNNGPKFKSGSDCYWGVTRAGVTLSYKWNLSRRNSKK